MEFMNKYSTCMKNYLNTSAKFVQILEQVKTLDCISSFHWSALKFSQMFALVFTENMFYFLNDHKHSSYLLTLWTSGSLSASQFSLHSSYKMIHLEMRIKESITQRILQKWKNSHTLLIQKVWEIVGRIWQFVIWCIQDLIGQHTALIKKLKFGCSNY